MLPDYRHTAAVMRSRHTAPMARLPSMRDASSLQACCSRVIAATPDMLAVFLQQSDAADS